jgi:hypothetical protein
MMFQVRQQCFMYFVNCAVIERAGEYQRGIALVCNDLHSGSDP